jgi:hypothetical protein
MSRIRCIHVLIGDNLENFRVLSSRLNSFVRKKFNKERGKRNNHPCHVPSISSYNELNNNNNHNRNRKNHSISGSSLHSRMQVSFYYSSNVYSLCRLCLCLSSHVFTLHFFVQQFINGTHRTRHVSENTRSR